MKKSLLFLLLLVLIAVVPACVQAEDRCSKHPNATAVRYVTYSRPEEYSVTKHKQLVAWMVCPICNDVLREIYEFEFHTFAGNTCTSCGYKRSSQNELANEARYLIDQNNIYNHGCWVMYDGKIYANPESSRILGSLEFGEDFYVNNYSEIGSTVWIEIKKLPSQSPIGWVRADILSIDQKRLEGPSGYEVGRIIRITTSSGRGRADAGTEFAYLETVHNGEKYTVLDAKTGTNGNTWYKIRVDGREVWISSSLATFD